MSDFAKAWYTSRGVWGGLISLLSVILGVFGYAISPEESEQLILALTAIGTAIGNVVGIYGRVKAKERLR
ncbi:MAG: hypothetical protein PHE38_12235 [Alishewanella agri]|nr:hypothetical protein [Alishewanella agri]